MSLIHTHRKGGEIMLEDRDDRSFEKLPIGSVLLREDDGELFEKSSATEVTSFFFTGTGLRYENDVATPWIGMMTRWDWRVLSDEEITTVQQGAMSTTLPLPFPWGLIVTALILIAVVYACSGR
jgi:hypothetical protein